MGSNISQQTTEHCTLGTCVIVSLPQCKGSFLQYYYIFQNGRQLSKYTKKLQQAANTPLLNYSWQPIQIKHQKSKCGETIVAKLYFSILMNNLANQFQIRSTKNYYFTQQQLCLSLGRLLTISLVGFNTKSKTLSVSPKNIVFNSQKFQNFKVLTNFSVPDQQKSYQLKQKKLDWLDYFASPQQLLSLSLGYESSEYDQHKSQIFSIGMLLLSMFILKDAKCYYSSDIQVGLHNQSQSNEVQNSKTSKEQKKQIRINGTGMTKHKKIQLGKPSKNIQLDYQRIKLCLKEVQNSNRYSKQFLQVVENMLEVSPSDRSNAQELLLKLEEENLFKQQDYFSTPIHKLGNKVGRNKQPNRNDCNISRKKQTGFSCGFGINGLQIVKSQILDENQIRERINPRQKIFN